MEIVIEGGELLPALDGYPDELDALMEVWAGEEGVGEGAGLLADLVVVDQDDGGVSVMLQALERLAAVSVGRR